MGCVGGSPSLGLFWHRAPRRRRIERRPPCGRRSIVTWPRVARAPRGVRRSRGERVVRARDAGEVSVFDGGRSDGLEYARTVCSGARRARRADVRAKDVLHRRRWTRRGERVSISAHSDGVRAGLGRTREPSANGLVNRSARCAMGRGMVTTMRRRNR